MGNTSGTATAITNAIVQHFGVRHPTRHPLDGGNGGLRPLSPRAERVRLPLRAALWVMMLVTVGGIGCQTALPLAGGSALGVAGYTFAGAKGSQGFPFPADQVQKAVLESLADLRMSDIRQSQEPGVTRISAVTADRRMADIVVISQPTFSLVTARIGAFGDSMQTRALFNWISNRLGAAPVSRTPVDVDTDRTAALDEERTTAEPNSSRGSSRPEVNPPRPKVDDEIPRPWVARDAVPDEVMLKDQIDAGYRDTLVP